MPGEFMFGIFRGLQQIYETFLTIKIGDVWPHKKTLAGGLSLPHELTSRHGKTN